MKLIFASLTFCFAVTPSEANTAVTSSASLPKNLGLCAFQSHNLQQFVGVYVPQCDVYGNFLPQQCWGSAGSCWCVNVITGKEIPNTRTPPGIIPVKCDADVNEGVDTDRGTFCPEGWTRWGLRCYIYINDLKTWVEAESYCQFEGANLASVHGNDENHFIQALTRGNTHNFPESWIGGHDAVKPTFWMWSDGSKFDYKNWAYAMSKRNISDNCLKINTGYDLRWQCTSCMEKLPFVCATYI
ncbi:hypothetical protein LDENG_00127230 [Lucifuga dentata]|nr:hypothetical protein LDENG_00127230 [Lucifuga dentata]